MDTLIGYLIYLVPLLVVLLPVLFIGGLAFLFIRIRQKEQARNTAFQAIAAQLNFQYLGETPYANLSGAANYEIFTSGNPGSWHIYNLITGMVNNIRVSIFDFGFYTGTDKLHRRSNQYPNFQTVVMLDLPQINLPPFLLKPQSGKIRQAVNHALGNRSGEIHLANHPAFSEKYLLRSIDEQRTRQLFNDRILSFYDSKADLTTEGGANRIIFYRDKIKIEPDNIRYVLDEAITAVGLFLN